MFSWCLCEVHQSLGTFYSNPIAWTKRFNDSQITTESEWFGDWGSHCQRSNELLLNQTVGCVKVILGTILGAIMYCNFDPWLQMPPPLENPRCFWLAFVFRLVALAMKHLRSSVIVCRFRVVIWCLTVLCNHCWLAWKLSFIPFISFYNRFHMSEMTWNDQHIGCVCLQNTSTKMIE